jgi:hypothetical protein
LSLSSETLPSAEPGWTDFVHAHYKVTARFNHRQTEFPA